MSRTSPLDAAHHEAGGRFISFAGWRLPVHYGSILAEAKAVREHAGMFDVSHMGRLRVWGPDAMAVLQRLGTNDLGRIRPGRCQYTLWCTPGGGVIDDLIVFWTDPEAFGVVLNAARRTDDLAHFAEHAADADLEWSDDTQTSAMLAVQGPDALGIAADLGAPKLRRFGVARAEVAGVRALVSRTGYTGEDGVEVVMQAELAGIVWDALLERGVVPCGLGARDALRMEMGYPLYGHELGPDISPLEAGVAFAVSLDDGDFVGREAIASAEPERKLVGFVCSKPCVPQPDDEIRLEASDAKGVVTSGGTSVVLGAPIGLAFVPREASLGPGSLHTRGKQIPVELRDVPLIERGRPGKSA